MRNHNPEERFYALRPSRKWAIEANCASFIGCTKLHLVEGFKREVVEGFKREVRNCTVLHCPIHSQALSHFNMVEAVNDETYSGARA